MAEKKQAQDQPAEGTAEAQNQQAIEMEEGGPPRSTKRMRAQDMQANIRGAEDRGKAQTFTTEAGTKVSAPADMADMLKRVGFKSGR